MFKKETKVRKINPISSKKSGAILSSDLVRRVF